MRIFGLFSLVWSSLFAYPLPGVRFGFLVIGELAVVASHEGSVGDVLVLDDERPGVIDVVDVAGFGRFLA